METAPENSANGNVNLEKLKDALDKSSSINRALGLSFGIFIFVIAIMVASTTDLQLFIPDSTFNFPFINLPLGIVNFFLAAPFVVLIMHYNLLYNLMQHSKKLLNWHNAKMRFNEHEGNSDTKSEEDLDMYPFLFNFALNVKNPIHNRTLNIVNRITIFMLPLALLCFILFRFADYQSIPITFWHFAAVLLDATLIATHSFSILKIIKTHNEALKEEYRFMEFFNFTKPGRGFKKLWKNAGTLIFTAFPAFFAVLFSLVITLLSGIWNLITKLKFWKAGVFKSAISSQVLLYKYLRIETFMVHLATFFVMFFNYIMVVEVDFRWDKTLPYQEQGYSIMESTIFKIKSFPYKFQKSILPSLNLREEILTKSQLEQQLIESHLNRAIDKEEREKVKQEIILGYSKSYNLKGRSLRYADFSNTILTKADFREADLTMSNLEFAYIQKANFHLANLQGADLLQAKLQGAEFPSAKLQGVILTQANLQGVFLDGANLQGYHLSYAHLQGADLSDANLQGAGLGDANLQGASLNFAELQGADLSDANLQGAGLGDANLQGADLEVANLQGAILNQTRLRGSIFSEDFSDTILLINEADETNNSIFEDKDFERYLDRTAALIPDTTRRTEFRNKLFAAKERYDKETQYLTIVQRLPKAKIYCLGDLETDSTFFQIRRKIASESKEIAQSMLSSTHPWKGDPYKSLYTDLYKFLKANHPDYLEGYEFDEEGEWEYIRK